MEKGRAIPDSGLKRFLQKGLSVIVFFVIALVGVTAIFAAVATALICTITFLPILLYSGLKTIIRE